MIQIRIISISTLIFLSFNSSSQSVLNSTNYVLDSNLLDFKVDKLNNEWYIYPHKIIRHSQDNAYSDTLNILNTNNRILIDLKFPLKNLFFNKLNNTVEILNSRWGSLTKFRLDKIGIFQPSFVRFAADKTLWILDISSNSLFKVNEIGINTYEKKNPFFVNDKFYFPNEFIDNKNYCVALDTTFGIFIIDDYGNLIQSIQIDSIQSIFDYKGNIYVKKGFSISKYTFNEIIKQLITSTKSIHFPFNVLAIEDKNEYALVFFENKRIYSIKNFEGLFIK